MYDFQRGHLNFDLDKLSPHESWPDKLERLMDYFKNDSQLRDILITGGDALMSSDKSLRQFRTRQFRTQVDQRRSSGPGSSGPRLIIVRPSSYLPSKRMAICDIGCPHADPAFLTGVRAEVVEMPSGWGFASSLGRRRTRQSVKVEDARKVPS